MGMKAIDRASLARRSFCDHLRAFQVLAARRQWRLKMDKENGNHRSSLTRNRRKIDDAASGNYREPLPSTKRTTILHPADMPKEYCMVAEGNCLDPVFCDGDPLQMDSRAIIRPGDFVAIWKRRDLVRPGEHQIIVKRFLRFDIVNGADCAIVEMINPQVRIVIPRWGIEGMHKCVGIVPKEVKRFRMSDEDFLASVRAEKQHAARSTCGPAHA